MPSSTDCLPPYSKSTDMDDKDDCDSDPVSEGQGGSLRAHLGNPPRQICFSSGPIAAFNVKDFVAKVRAAR